MHPTQLHELTANPLLTEAQNIEMAIRLLVREAFEDTMKGVAAGSLSGVELNALEEVMFEIVYPVFQGRRG